jgi:hypothetical protein
MSPFHVSRQICSLAPPPPRTPARPDPQVPHDPRLGPALWGKIGALYVYRSADSRDALYGFNDIEVSLQRIGPGAVRFELYAIGDGYQQAGAKLHPLRICLNGGAGTLAEFVWSPPAIADGCADPIAFSHDLALSEAAWRDASSVEIEAARD